MENIANYVFLKPGRRPMCVCGGGSCLLCLPHFLNFLIVEYAFSKNINTSGHRVYETDDKALFIDRESGMCFPIPLSDLNSHFQSLSYEKILFALTYTKAANLTVFLLLYVLYIAPDNGRGTQRYLTNQ